LPVEAGAFIGTADQVAAHIAGFLEAGVDEVIVELPAAHDPDVVQKAGRVLQMALQAAGGDSHLEVRHVEPKR
jgi:alkanesulfonate monooxygenase SsuD/methylene tetrahydromethanopterin reductase-like flavin-dependent oxidoreductase (luciferase family)